MLLQGSGDWLRSNICATFRCENLLGAGIGVLSSILHPKITVYQCVSFGSPSQPVRQRIRRRTVTLYFNLHWNSQIHAFGSQRMSNLISFYHCVELRSSNAQGCQALKCRSRCHCVIVLFSRLGRQQSRCPRRL